MNRLLNAASIVAMVHKQPKRCPHCVRPLLSCMLCNTFAGCVTVRSPDAQLAYLEAELVPWLLQAPMHTRALATLKMQMVKTRLQKSKLTTSLTLLRPRTALVLPLFPCQVPCCIALLHGIEDAVKLACMLD